MKDIIVQRAKELEFDECRVTGASPPPHRRQFLKWLENRRHGAMGYLERNAHKRIDPCKVLDNARSVISLAVSYYPPGGETRSAPESRPGGVIARYARYSDYHEVLAERLAELSRHLAERGGPGTRSLWYVDTGPLLERDLAQRAGVGFIGKHTNLIHRRLGNWIFLSEILTTLPLPADAPERNRCGKCRLCLDACPTDAFAGPFELDARKCISYLTIELKGSIPEELRPLIGNRIFGCDDCLAVCPWNRFAKEGALMRGHHKPEMGQPDLLELLQLDDVSFRARFRNTPIFRSKRRGLLRNVCVALGNVGDATALPALRQAAEDPEPLIAEHARWAIGQILRRSKPVPFGASLQRRFNV